jgi:hypothetical protein
LAGTHGFQAADQARNTAEAYVSGFVVNRRGEPVLWRVASGQQALDSPHEAKRNAGFSVLRPPRVSLGSSRLRPAVDVLVDDYLDANPAAHAAYTSANFNSNPGGSSAIAPSRTICVQDGVIGPARVMENERLDRTGDQIMGDARQAEITGELFRCIDAARRRRQHLDHDDRIGDFHSGGCDFRPPTAFKSRRFCNARR